MTTIVNVMDYGAVGDNVADDTVAIQNAIASYSSGGVGPTVYFPSGEYRVTSNIQIKTTVTLIGDSNGNTYGPSARIRPDGCSGFTFNDDDTINGGLDSPATTTSKGSVMRNLAFLGDSTADTWGVWLRTRVHALDCWFQGFRDGVKIVASDAGAADVRGDASYSVIERVTSSANLRHGFWISGTHAKHITFLGGDGNSNGTVSDTGGWNWYDDSAGGHTYITCHSATGGYYAGHLGEEGGYYGVTTGANSYLGCYSELTEEGLVIDSPSVILGGFMTRNFGTGMFIGADRVTPFSVPFTAAANPDRELSTSFGLNENAIQLNAEGDTTNGWGLKWIETGKGWWEMKHAGGNSAFALTTALTDTLGSGMTMTDGSALPDGKFVFRDDPLVEISGSVMAALDMSTVAQKANYTGSGIPTTGVARRGDIIWNTAPSSGGTLGWICTTAGNNDGTPTASVWKVMGGTIA